MQIHEVCEQYHLTKKAVEYYEKKGLISPEILENGYRDYKKQDIAVLKEVSVLRQCGIGLSDIKLILSSSNKSAALEKCKYLIDLRNDRLRVIQKCMDNLIRSYDVDREFSALQRQDEDMLTLKERIVLAFPGNYGLFLSLHFGRFLNEPVDTEEKRQAFHAILAFLDRVEIHLTPELEEYLQAFSTGYMQRSMAEMEAESQRQMTNAIANFDGYLESNREDIEKYLAYKRSDAFRTSSAGQMQHQLLAFQKNSGYQEIFIRNLKCLSRAYTAYLQEIQRVNETVYKKFPEACSLYAD